MKGYIEQRSRIIALYMVESQCTVRQAARKFEISKSTVHKDITERLPEYDSSLYKEVRKLLDKNMKERNMRGGLAFQAKRKSAKKD